MDMNASLFRRNRSKGHSNKGDVDALILMIMSIANVTRIISTAYLDGGEY